MAEKDQDCKAGGRHCCGGNHNGGEQEAQARVHKTQTAVGQSSRNEKTMFFFFGSLVLISGLVFLVGKAEVLYLLINYCTVQHNSFVSFLVFFGSSGGPHGKIGKVARADGKENKAQRGTGALGRKRSRIPQEAP